VPLLAVSRAARHVCRIAFVRDIAQHPMACLLLICRCRKGTAIPRSAAV